MLRGLQSARARLWEWPRVCAQSKAHRRSRNQLPSHQPGSCEHPGVSFSPKVGGVVLSPSFECCVKTKGLNWAAWFSGGGAFQTRVLAGKSTTLTALPPQTFQF